MLVEADPHRDRPREQRETAGNQGAIGAVGPHRPNQRGSARRERDPVVEDLLDGRHRQAAQEGDALAQGRLEGDLAPHGPFRDARDLLFHAGEVGQFVDTFLSDHGRIHVGEEKRLAAIRGRLQHDVDRGGAEARRDGLPQGRQRVDGRGEADVGRNLRIEPDGRLRVRQQFGEARQTRGSRSPSALYGS